MIILIIVTILYFPLVYSVYVLNQTSIYAENGVLENIQVVILIASCLAFLLPLIRRKSEGKLIFLFFLFLCFSFILTEVDIKDFDIPSVLIFIGSGIGRNLMLSIGFIAIAIYGVLNISYYKKLGRVLIISRESLLIIMAGVFLVAGSYFENHKLILHHAFLEEMFELSGYIAILLSALILSKNKLLDIAT